MSTISERYWMATAKLRALARSRYTLDEIAEFNERDTGWRPSRSTVSKKLSAMGEEARYGSRKDLIPWRVEQKHYGSRLRAMLQAESRRRAGQELSDTDFKNINLLHDLLMGRGTPLVIGYDHRLGFFLSDRVASDTDIIRYDGQGSLEQKVNGQEKEE